MKILIFGGSGFIGSQFINKFIGKYIILNYSRSKLKIQNNKFFQINDEISNINHHFEQILNFAPDYCLNFLWEGIPNFSEAMCKLNLNNNKIIIDLVSELKCKKIITTGTCLEYFGLKDKVTEKQIGTKKNIFAKTKIKIKNYQEKICNKNNINSIWLRLFFVYGKNQRKESLIPYIISQSKKNNKIKLNNPNTANDYIFLDDVIKIIDKVISIKEPKLTLNVGSGLLIKNIDIAKIILKIFKKENLLINNFKEESNLNEFFASTELLKNKIYFNKFTKIEEGLKKIINT